MAEEGEVGGGLMEPRAKDVETVEQSEDAGIVAAVTAIVREADQLFERVGGSSRHWVRDCFLPLLNKEGFSIQCARCRHCGEDTPERDEER